MYVADGGGGHWLLSEENGTKKRLNSTNCSIIVPWKDVEDIQIELPNVMAGTTAAPQSPEYAPFKSHALGVDPQCKRVLDFYCHTVIHVYSTPTTPDQPSPLVQPHRTQNYR